MAFRDDASKYHVFASTDAARLSAQHGESSVKKRDGLQRRKKSSDSDPFAGASYVFRHKLVDGMISSLERDGLVVLCGEYGLGRHVAARQLISTLRERGAVTTELRVSGLCGETVCRKVRLAFKEAAEITREGGHALVSIDGLGILDDPLLGRLSRSISNGVLSGCMVVVLLDPDCESMLEFLPSCHVVRAPELLLESSEYAAWESLFGGFSVMDARRCTHGITSLLAVLRAVRCLPDGTPYGAAWDRVVGDLFSHALRPELIKEELAVRCGMAALGFGDVQELERLGIRVSRDILREIALSAPLFGVDLETGSFELVPCESYSVAAALAALPRGYEAVLSASIRELALSGRVGRAASIASALPNESNLRMLASEFPLEMIDAGQSKALIREVFSDEGSPELEPARKILRGLGITHLIPNEPDFAGFGLVRGNEEKCTSGPCARVLTHLRLVEAMGEVKRTGRYPVDRQEDERVAIIGGISAMRLLARGRELEMRLHGRSTEAFRELLVSRELREQRGEPSVFSAMLAYDFESLRVLVGDPEASGDQMRLTKAREVLEGCAPVSMRMESETILSLSSVASGVNCSLFSAERFSSAREQAGQASLLAWINLGIGVANLCGGSFRNAYVRAQSACRQALESELSDVVLASAMVERAALSSLGENPASCSEAAGDFAVTAYREPAAGEDGEVGRRSLVAGDEPSVDLVLLSQLCEAIWNDGPEALANASVAMRGLIPRVEVMAFAACLARADRSRGARLADALPISWRPRRLQPQVVQEGVAITGRWCDVDGVGGTCGSRDDIPLLEVCVMDGFSVRRGGVRISEREWRRRRSRDLISMLALTPGHMLSRHDAINQLWEDADPIRGRESLYSVLSSLRSTIGQTLPELKYIVGEQGKIWLDESLVVCDVDEFERVARQVMGRRIPDDEAISLCLRMEGMYGSGSYLPSSDVDGRYRRRHEELSRRFVDAMLTGADAARRLRDERQAQWFLETARVERGNCPKIALA